MTGNEIARALERIRQENRQGATALTRDAVKLVIEALQKGADRESLAQIAVALAGARPMMALVFDFANRLLFWLDEVPRESLETLCRRYLRQMEEANRLAIGRAMELMRPYRTAVIHSASSMVAELLERLHEEGHSMRLFCTESRPAREGLSMGRRLCEAGMDVTLVVDAAAGLAMREADLFLIGADGIGVEGVVHKVGTYPMALAAREEGVELLCLATTMKIWPKERGPLTEPAKPPEEIGATGCLGGMNRYFDMTPLRLFTNIVTEAGVERGADVGIRCGSLPLHQRLRS